LAGCFAGRNVSEYRFENCRLVAGISCCHWVTHLETAFSRSEKKFEGTAIRRCSSRYLGQ
jgi:hypothetical protein